MPAKKKLATTIEAIKVCVISYLRSGLQYGLQSFTNNR
jgi:hypothetical protein